MTTIQNSLEIMTTIQNVGISIVINLLLLRFINDICIIIIGNNIPVDEWKRSTSYPPAFSKSSNIIICCF